MLALHTTSTPSIPGNMLYHQHLLHLEQSCGAFGCVCSWFDGCTTSMNTHRICLRNVISKTLSCGICTRCGNCSCSKLRWRRVRDRAASYWICRASACWICCSPNRSPVKTSCSVGVTGTSPSQHLRRVRSIGFRSDWNRLRGTLFRIECLGLNVLPRIHGLIFKKFNELVESCSDDASKYGAHPVYPVIFFERMQYHTGTETSCRVQTAAGEENLKPVSHFHERFRGV